MKNTKLLVVALLVIALCLGIFTACANSGDDTPKGSTQPSGEAKPDGPTQPSGEVQLKEITGITFPSLTVTYDSQPHSVRIEGTLPQGVSVAYQNAQKTDAGEYEAVATLSGEGYETLVLKTKLIIEKAELQGISFPSVKEEYDGLPHYVSVAGLLPEGCNISYSCKENPSIKDNATASGRYTITATITHPNYKTVVLNTTLEITASEKERHIVYAGGKLYFANALDGDKLYYYTSQEGVKKISSDEPRNFAVTSNGDVYYKGYNAIVPSIKKIDGSSTSTVEPKNAEYLCTDGTNLYFAINSLLAKEKGIYKITINNSTQTVSEPTLLSEGKAEYLQVYGNYLYFADGNNGNKLSRMSINGGTRTQIVNEKISALTADSGYLFFTVDNLLGDYIANYNISTGATRKLTVDAGSNLTLIGNDLYYLNVDKLTSYINGKGIYKVDAKPSSDKNASGTKVIGAENENYTSLTKYSSNIIAYYKVSNQMLCLYNLSNGSVTEVLKGFTAPESTPITTGSKLATYGNYIYYMDIYNDKSLYSYNTLTKAFSRITAGKVIDFSILGDTLYFNTESRLVKNYLYKLDLKTVGSIPELISENDCVDIVQGGDKIFYVEKNNLKGRTAIHEINAQGVDTMIYSKGAHCLTYYDGYIYFEDGKDLLKMPINGYTYNEPITVKEGNVDTFVISNGVVYFREMYGVGWTNKSLTRINVDGSGYARIVSKGTDPLKIIVDGDTIYYYNDVTLGDSGIYSISVNARENETPKLILARDSKYYAEEMALKNGKLYFVNYYNNLGDSHFYSVDIKTKALEKLR